MQRRKKDRKLREKSGRNREKKMLGPRPVCIMKMCKKPIHILFFFFFFSSETQYTHKYFQTNSLDWDPPNWATTHEQHKSMKMLVTLVGENFERM